MRKTMEKITVLSLSLILTTAFSVSPALPAMLNYYDKYSDAQVELLISVPAFAITVMIILNTWISKYVKERLIITGGLLITTLGGIIPVFIQDYKIVFIGRILYGAGIGLINARAISIISERYEGKEKVTLLGYRGSAEVLGNAVLTLLAGRLILIKWSSVFAIYAIGAVILGLYVIFIPKEKGVKCIEADKKESAKLGGRHIIDVAGYTILSALLICINASNSLRIPMLAIEKGYGTESQASIVLSILMVTGILAGFLFGKLSNICKHTLIVLGLCGLGAGMLWMPLTNSLGLLTIGAIITGFFYTVSLTCVFNEISEKVPGNLVNTATSVVLVGCNMGAACSPMILKIIGKINANVETGFIVYGGLVILIGIIILIGRKKSH